MNNYRFSTVVLILTVWLLTPSPAMAVMPMADGSPLPQAVIDAQKAYWENYELQGIALRLRQIKMEKQKAAFEGRAFRSQVFNTSIPVLMGNYSDNAQIFDSADFQTLLFGANPTGSMTNYYDEVSYGQFHLTGSVYGPYTAPQTQV